MRLIGMAGRRVGFNDCVGNELLGGGGKMVGQRDTQIQMVVYKNGASYLLLPSVTPTPRGRTLWMVGATNRVWCKNGGTARYPHTV